MNASDLVIAIRKPGALNRFALTHEEAVAAIAKVINAALDLPGYTHAETIGEVRAIAQGDGK